MTSYVPSLTSVQRDVEILTFQDLVERVLDLFGLDRTKDRNVRRARQAVAKAVRDIANIYRWSNYRRMWILTVDAQFTTGTVAIDYETRIATFSSTIPSWAAYGTLQILGSAEDGPEYEAESRLSDTTLLLRSEANVGADVASTSSFRLVRRYYPVPVDLKEILSFRDVDNETDLTKMSSPAMADSRVYTYREPDVPRMFQLRGYANSLMSRIVELSPPPDDDYVYHVAYLAQARPLQHDYFTTKATVAADGLTVTSSETLPQDIVGSVVRFSDDSGYPTSQLGAVDGTTNPWKCQRVVTARSSGTTFTIDAVTGEAFTSVGAVLSDPVDIMPSIMLSAVQAAAEAEFAMAVMSEQETISRLRSRARQELQLGIEADSAGSCLIRGGSLMAWPVTAYDTTYGDGTNYPS
jgi:hypothetical protein